MLHFDRRHRVVAWAGYPIVQHTAAVKECSEKRAGGGQGAGLVNDIESINEVKALQDNGRVLVNSECGVTDRLPHLVAVPELLMSGPPFGDRTETLAFIGGVPGADITEPDDGDTCGLNHRYGAVARVDHERVLAR